MKAVSPYRPFAPESPAHLKLGAFDWPAALTMLRASVRESCQCETFALTDRATQLPVPAHRYDTHEPRLMLWLLEVCLRYLESSDFDEDTVMLSPDVLVFDDLRPWFRADLGVIVRVAKKFADKKPLLNGVQFWRVEAQDRLVAFYRAVLALARTLPESEICWGADTEPIRRLLHPLQAGPMERAGLSVFGIRRMQMFVTVSSVDIANIRAGGRPSPLTPIIDFKYLRKHHMRDYFNATLGERATA